MLENVEDLLDRYFDKDLAASAVEGLQAYCANEAAIYDLRGQRLWATKPESQPALPATVREDAALAGAIEQAKTLRTAVSAPHGETPRVIAPIMILEGPAGFLVLAPRLERAGTGNALQRLETLASMCGALFGEALTGKRTGADLAAELTARYEELSLVYTLTEALDISKPEHEALAIICDAVAHTLGADLLILEVPALGHCTFYPDSPEDTEARQQLAAALLEELAAAPRTTATNYLDQSEKYARIAKPFAHAACVPLTVDNDLGMIAL
ncbi:MAG: hypothetical protein HYZ00_12315, partial [Candidatus Hydrogenedentes bacterium]|nr:hypothetical protein [Candidatus Hydrogenedentota bacterium]